MKYKKGTYSLLLLIVASILAIQLFNVIVDPYKIFGLTILDLRQYYNIDRIAHSINLKRMDLDTVILGSSRTQIGIDINNKNFTRNRTYNASLSGTNIYEIEKVVRYIVTNKKNLKRVVWGLDFLTFSTRREIKDSFNLSLFSVNDSLPLFLFKLEVSFNTTSDSIDTIKKTLRVDKAQAYWDNGYLNKENQQVNHKLLFRQILTDNFLVSPETYGCFEYGKDRLIMFEESLELLAKNNINTYLFISPLHARHYEALDSLGLLEQYFSWMKDIVMIVGRVNNKYPADIVIWNFSGYNDVTTESVPSQVSEQMKYYWESSHYKKIVGDAIIGSIFSVSSDNYGNFGVVLSPDNIDSVIEEFITGHENYKRNNFNEVQDVRKLAAETSSLRESKCRAFISE